MHSLIQLKNLTNNAVKSSIVSTFIVLSDKDLIRSDWISALKFEQINEKEISKDPISYILKDCKESNVDEGISGHVGKALSVSLIENNIVIKIYTASKKDDWKFVHDYTISKELYNAYLLCMQNNTKTVELEKKAKNNKKFDLKLV